MSKCYVDPTRERDCDNCHSVSCNKEQAEFVEATEPVGTVSEPKGNVCPHCGRPYEEAKSVSSEVVNQTHSKVADQRPVWEKSDDELTPGELFYRRQDRGETSSSEDAFRF